MFELLKCSLKLFQEPDIVFEVKTQIVDLVFKHCRSFDAHSECKSGVFNAVNATCFKNCRMYHAAAQNFEPAGIFTNIAAFATAYCTAHIHLCRRLCKREVRRSEPYFDIFSIHLTGKVKKGLP